MCEDDTCARTRVCVRMAHECVMTIHLCEDDNVCVRTIHEGVRYVMMILCV